MTVPTRLDTDGPPLARCSRCGRSTWSLSEIDTEDRMTQPDGGPCGGKFVVVIKVGAPTLGQIAEVMREWQAHGVTLASIEYCIGRVFWAELDARAKTA